MLSSRARRIALFALPVFAVLALSACTRTYVEREVPSQQPTVVVPQGSTQQPTVVVPQGSTQQPSVIVR
jgi:hypothetical protein